LAKEGRRWRKPARGGWNPRGTHHPRHGLRPWHPSSTEEGNFFALAIASRTYVATYRDEARQAAMESFGIHFLRFRNVEVFEHLDVVLAAIARHLLELERN
jgi:uncharacterized protein DUF559